MYEILFINQHYETLEVTSDRFYVDRICTKMYPENYYYYYYYYSNKTVME